MFQHYGLIWPDLSYFWLTRAR